VLRSIGKQSGESMESVQEKKRYTVEKFLSIYGKVPAAELPEHVPQSNRTQHGHIYWTVRGLTELSLQRHCAVPLFRPTCFTEHVPASLLPELVSKWTVYQEAVLASQIWSWRHWPAPLPSYYIHKSMALLCGPLMIIYHHPHLYVGCFDSKQINTQPWLNLSLLLVTISIVVHLLCICTLFAIYTPELGLNYPQHTQTAISQKRLHILLRNFPSLLEYGSHKSLWIYVTARSKIQYSTLASRMLFYSHALQAYIKQMSTPSSIKHLYSECMSWQKSAIFIILCYRLPYNKNNPSATHSMHELQAQNQVKYRAIDAATHVVCGRSADRPSVCQSVPSIDNSSEVVCCYKRGRLQQI